MAILPKQKLTEKEKTTKDPVTGKTPRQATIDYYIDDGFWDNDQEEILSLYRLLDDELDGKDYEYILNPFNTTIDRYKRFGSKLRNFNIINPVIDLYQGEFGKRFKAIQVLQTNSEDESEYEKGLNELIDKYYAAKIANELAALGIETGGDPEGQQAPLNQQVEEFNQTFGETRVISGQQILDYIYYDQDLLDKYQDVVRDWLVTGRAFTYKGIFNDDIDFEHVPSWEIRYPKNKRSAFIENADYVVRRQVMPVNQILDRWHNHPQMDDDMLTWLEEQSRNSDDSNRASGFTVLPSAFVGTRKDYDDVSILRSYTGIEVYHVQYRSFRKVGILTRIGDLGLPEEVEVDDSYKLDKEAGDINIEWGWESVVEEGWRLDRDKYLDDRVLPYNRMEINNHSEQKLSYNGRINDTLDGGIKSIAKTGRPYQIIYNILHYQFEKLINKNKDKLAVIPIGAIPKGRYGWDEEKFMYQAHASSMMFIDESNPGTIAALQGIKVLDMSLGTYINDMIQMMQSVKAEWWESIGMNRQRYGDTKASDGKGITEQAIYRSAIISEELFRKFEKFQEKDYAGLLDLSKLAYINGKKAKYINGTGREAFLAINPDDAIYFTETSFDVFVKSSTIENEKIETAKQFGIGLGQSGGNTQEVLELIDSNNFAYTKSVIQKIENKRIAREEAQAQAERDNALEIENKKAETAAADRQVQMYEADKKYDTAIDSALLKMGEGGQDADGKDDNLEDSETIRMNNHKIKVDTENLNISKQELQRKSKETKAKIKNMNSNNTNNR